MASKYPSVQFFRGKDGMTYFRIRARNGRIRMVSEGYTDRNKAYRGYAGLQLDLRGAVTLINRWSEPKCSRP